MELLIYVVLGVLVVGGFSLVALHYIDNSIESWKSKHPDLPVPSFLQTSNIVAKIILGACIFTLFLCLTLMLW